MSNQPCEWTPCRQRQPTRSRALVQSSFSVEPCEPAAQGSQESGVGISSACLQLKATAGGRGGGWGSHQKPQEGSARTGG